MADLEHSLVDVDEDEDETTGRDHEESWVGSESEGDPSELANPYDERFDRRGQVTNKKSEALIKWKKRVKIWSAILIICSGFLMYSDIWYANVIGVAAGGLGIYGAVKENSEFLFVYLVLLFLELLKNVGIFFYFISDDNIDATVIISCAFCLIEEFFVVPANIFYAFKLYRTIKVSTDTDLESTISGYR